MTVCLFVSFFYLCIEERRRRRRGKVEVEVEKNEKKSAIGLMISKKAGRRRRHAAVKRPKFVNPRAPFESTERSRHASLEKKDLERTEKRCKKAEIFFFFFLFLVTMIMLMMQKKKRERSNTLYLALLRERAAVSGGDLLDVNTHGARGKGDGPAVGAGKRAKGRSGDARGGKH